MDGSGPAVPPRTKVTAEAVRTRKLELNLPDATSQQSAAAWFRGVLRLPDELKQNCVDDIVDLMPRFVELLSSEHQAVVTEAASVVANIAASPGENSSSRVIDSGAVPLLIKLLGSTDNNDLKDHAALALGNVAIGSAQARNHVIDSDGLEPLLKVMDDFVEGQSTSARVLNSTVWTVSQLCRAVPRPSVEVLRPVLPVLTQLLVTAGDEEVLVDACWAISYLAEDFAYLEVVCQPEIVKVVVNLLDHPSNGVRTAAVRASGNFVTGNDRQTQVVIEAGGLEAFGKLIESPVDEHCKDAVWAISNIAAGTQEQIQRVIDANLIPKLVRAWHTRCETVKTEAAWALCNFCTGGSPEQFKYLMSQRHAVTPLVCVLLESKDTALAGGARNAIDALTKAGEEERQRNNTDQNDYARAVEDAQKARTAFMRAQRFESDKNWNAAIESYTEAMRHYWNPEKCHNRMGICYSKLGQHAEAFTEYDAVLKINPHDGVGYCNRGRKHLALGRFQEAEADALMSLKLNPKHKTSQQLLLDARKKTTTQDLPGTEAELYSQAEKLRKHKQWSAAIDAFSELLDTDYPGKAHLLNQRGVCYQELGQHEDALRDLTESLELDPSQPVSKLCNRADVFRDLERFDQAVDDLNRVIEMAPDDGAAKAQLAEVQTAMAVPASARTAFKNAKKKYNADEWENAIAGFTDAISSGLGKSETYIAWVMRGWSYHQVGKMEESLRDFDMAVADDPARVVGLYSRGIAHKRGGRAHQAKEDCDHAVDLTWEDLARASLEDFGLPPLGVEEQMCDVPEGIRVFFTQLAGAVIGDEMFGMRCFEAAVSAYSLALRSTANATLVVPRDALCRWHFQRGRCYLLLHRNVEAMSDFTTVISKVPENKPKLADAHFFRGHLYSQQDKWVEAEQDLQICLKLKPAHETAGELLNSTKEKLSSRARNAEEAEKELLAQLDKDQEREKKKREKNKLKKQRQKDKKKKEPPAGNSQGAEAADEPARMHKSSAAAVKGLSPKAVSPTAQKAPTAPAPEPAPAPKDPDTATSPAAGRQNATDSSASKSETSKAEAEPIREAASTSTAAAAAAAAAPPKQPDSAPKKRRGGRSTEASGNGGINAPPGRHDKQQSDAAPASAVPRPTARVVVPASDLVDEDCPLCCEPFDATDLAFTPCPCGYKVCVWCYHRLKDDTDGQCPACRQGYREVEQKVVEVAKRAAQDKDSSDRRPTTSKSESAEESWMRRLFAATEGGLRQCASLLRTACLHPKPLHLCRRN
jgi:tetratricopeptide (TPR) repeat protein